MTWKALIKHPDSMQRIFMLVGGLEHVLFFHILGIIIPTDKLIFFRGVETTNQLYYMIIICNKLYDVLSLPGLSNDHFLCFWKNTSRKGVAVFTIFEYAAPFWDLQF